MLDFIIGGALPWILGIVGFFGSIAFAWLRGGKANESKHIERRLKGMQEAREIEREVADADRNTVVDINSK